MEAALDIRLLGPMSVAREGASVALPRSRKVRALLAYLVLERGPVSRARLCDLLWDVPNDPRGELRWCLSKLRRVLDDAHRRRVVTSGPSLVELDLEDCRVDVVEIERLITDGVSKAPSDQLAAASALVGGELLEGSEVEGPALTGWLAAQRQRFHAVHVAVLEELATRAERGSKERFQRLEAWVQASPFDTRPHEAMIEALTSVGRTREAESHLNATIRAFEREGIEWGSLRAAWQRARSSAAALGAEPGERSVATLAATELSPLPSLLEQTRRRGSVVVMPFVDTTSRSSGLAHGLTDDIITRLAKLRALFVIARGTSYALRDRAVAPSEAARLLDVEFAVSGALRARGERTSVLVELVRSSTGGIVWTDELEYGAEETFSVLDTIVDRIVAAIAEEIERAESKRALLKPPSSLDAWEAYHRGLWHMYKFTGPDNAVSAGFFRDALRLDPSFSRAHAGLSFTHFQNVFLGLTPDREQQITLALASAAQSVAEDDRDPAAHWSMGRALWLSGSQGEALGELRRSVDLSPSFALGHYTLGFVQAQSGDPSSAIGACNYSRELSPFDPLQFGMLASRALAHMRLGEREAAADWAVKAARRPNAHAHILAIAAVNLAIASRREEARALVARIRGQLPHYTVDDFLRAFRFTPDGEALVRSGARAIEFG